MLRKTSCIVWSIIYGLQDLLNFLYNIWWSQNPKAQWPSNISYSKKYGIIFPVYELLSQNLIIKIIKRAGVSLYIYIDINRIILRMDIILTSKSWILNISVCKTIRIYLIMYKNNWQRNHCIFLSDKRILNQLCIESFYTIEFKIAQLNSTVQNLK